MRKKIFITVNLLLLVLFACFGQASGEALKRYAPQTKVFEPEASHIFFAPDVPMEVIKRLAEIPTERLKSETYPSIYKMPLSKNLYLVAVSRNDDLESEYVLFKDEGGKLVEAGRSRKIENTIVNTTFFIGKMRVLIIADVAVPPDFTNLEALEFKNGRLKYLGNLAVAEQEKPAGVDGDFVSPANKAAAEYKSGTYFITLKGKLFSGWSESGGKSINAPATYRYDGKKFRAVGKRQRSSVLIKRYRRQTKQYV